MVATELDFVNERAKCSSLKFIRDLRWTAVGKREIKGNFLVSSSNAAKGCIDNYMTGSSQLDGFTSPTLERIVSSRQNSSLSLGKINLLHCDFPYLRAPSPFRANILAEIPKVQYKNTIQYSTLPQYKEIAKKEKKAYSRRY